jgi:hypothetical protein
VLDSYEDVLSSKDFTDVFYYVLFSTARMDDPQAACQGAHTEMISDCSVTAYCCDQCTDLAVSFCAASDNCYIDILDRAISTN